MGLLDRFRKPDPKGEAELAYWRERRHQQGPLEEGAHWYRYFFTEHFGLADDFFAGKRMLDVGCGPRGSLTWATMAAQRVGVDPLADDYRKLQAADHGMDYVKSGAEAMPFADGSFDVVSSINSLDHVDDADAAIAELARVTAPGGTLLVVVDIGHEPTPTEPQAFAWDIAEKFERDWTVVDRRAFERPGDNMFHNLRDGHAYDESDPAERPAVLSLRLERR